MIHAKTLADLGWPQLVDHLAGRAHTRRGAEQLRGLSFFAEPEAAAARAEEIGEARQLCAAGEPLLFGGIVDVLAIVDRARKGSILAPEELIAVGDTGHGCTRLGAHLRGHSDVAPRLATIAAGIEDLGHIYHPIRDSFDNDGHLLDQASEDLGRLRHRAINVKNKLEGRARELVDSSRMAPYLQDTYYTQREERYVLPIKLESRSFVKGIVHGSSQSGQTVFVEPDALIELNNTLKLAECDVADEERRILTRLTSYVAEDAAALEKALVVATDLDVISAEAEIADLVAGQPATVARGSELELREVRHPLMLLSGRSCVANDIAMAPQSILVISGPNAGGKTVALKIVGLMALMVRAGLHLPCAAASKVPWYDTVSTDIGDAQSLEQDLSTFSAHLLNLNEFLADAGGDSLLLIDEIAVGTEPEQGAALAEAVLEALAAKRIPVVVTTHYERLKALAAANPRFANASVGFDLDAMEPTFRLHLGVPGSSGALRVARKLGLPSAVAERAEELLGSHRAEVEELLMTLAEQRRRLDDDRAALAEELDVAARERKQAEEAHAAARARIKEIHRGVHNEAIAALREARDEIDRVRAGIKRRKRVDQLGEAKQAIAAEAGKVAANAPEEPPPPGSPPRPEELAVGTPVMVVGLGHGTVVGAPTRGRVTVQIGNVRTTTRLDAVRLDERPHVKKSRVRSAPSKGGSRQRQVNIVRADDEGRALARTRDTTVDVRGERADDAVMMVDRFIDDSLIAVRDVIFIIHGHGTGALRNAIRTHLKLHQAVEKWRPGELSEGGDGVTVAWLDVS